MMTLSEQISEFITRFDLDTIPEAVIVRARLHLLDTLGLPSPEHVRRPRLTLAVY